MPLVHLDLTGSGQLTDLTALDSPQLTSLSLYQCGQLNNLAPLKVCLSSTSGFRSAAR